MSYEFETKHIHSSIWLIAILIVVIAIAGWAVIYFTDNAPVGEIVPGVEVEPANPAASLPEQTGQEPSAGPDSETAGTETSDTTPSQPVVQKRQAGRVLASAGSQAALGEEISVEVYLDTDEYNINVAKIALAYDPAILDYVDFSEANSVLAMQFRDDMEPGLVVISRGSPGDADAYDDDDAFTGSRGLFGTFRFTASAAGRTELEFDQENTVFYLDDGQGTKIYPPGESINISIN